MSTNSTLEVWKPVVGIGEFFELRFEVSNQGRVRSKSTRRILSQHLNYKGYPRAYFHLGRFGLKRSSRQLRVFIHKLVCLAFIGPRPKGMQINHIDGNKLNNVVTNLEYLSAQAHGKHSAVNNLSAYGERCAMSKLTEEQVKWIRAFYIPKCRGRGDRVIARMFGVDRKTIQCILKRRTWKRVI